jgi:iron complex transport system ATP-binding protein
VTIFHELSARDLSAGYNGVKVVNGVSLTVPCARISVIIGANACGKSTLLKTFARLIKPSGGGVTLNGEPVQRIPAKKLARRIGLLPQSPSAPEGIAVADLVGRGRFPHQRFPQGWTKADYSAVAEALETMGILDIADRNVDELSGGQRQRVWVAMALAQQTDILLLDEPTTFLDLTHQIEILDQLTDLNSRRGTTILMVLHDINLAARYADHMFALRKGELAAEGPPEKVVTRDVIRQVFNLDCRIETCAVSGAPMVLPIGRRHVQVPHFDLH